MAELTSEYTTSPASQDEYIRKVHAAERDLSDLYARMDDDKALYLLDPFTFRNIKGEVVKEVRNVTLNAPAVYAEQVKSTLTGANQQVVVQGVSDTLANHVEEFIEAMLVDADEALLDMGDAGLFAFMVEQSAIRGRMAARVAIVQGPDGPYLDVQPWDTRFVTWKVSGRSLAWACYKSYRDAADVVDEYPDAAALFGKRKSKLRVHDYWDREVNRVYCDNKLILEQPHSIGAVPVAAVVVPSGTNLRDDDAFKHHGESIFSLNRELYPELNRVATVMQTLNEMYIRPPVQRTSKAGETAEPVEAYPYKTGSVWNVEVGGGFAPMPVQDIHAATRYFYNILEQYLQRGALPSIDYGNLTFPLSAVALTNLGDKADKLYVPRLQALGLFYRQVAQLVIAQMKALDAPLPLGEQGRKAEFTYDRLQGQYTIGFKYYANAPSQDIANHAVAAQAAAFLDNDTILRDILKLRDPEKVKDNRRSDMAEAMNPIIGMYRTVHSLIDKAKDDPTKDIEARILFKQLTDALEQQVQGNADMQEKMAQAMMGGQEKPGPDQLIPLLDSSKGGGGRRANEDEVPA